MHHQTGGRGDADAHAIGNGGATRKNSSPKGQVPTAARLDGGEARLIQNLVIAQFYFDQAAR
jgi:hypothetical protein